MAEIQSVPCLMSQILFDESGQERQVGWYEYLNGTKNLYMRKQLFFQLQ